MNILSRHQFLVITWKWNVWFESIIFTILKFCVLHYQLYWYMINMSKIGKVLRFQFSHRRMSKMLLLIYCLGWLSIFSFFMTNLVAQNNICFLSLFCKSEAWVGSTMYFAYHKSKTVVSISLWYHLELRVLFQAQGSWKNSVSQLRRVWDPWILAVCHIGVTLRSWRPPTSLPWGST